MLRIVLPITACASVLLLINAATGFGGFVGILAPLFICVASVGFVVPNTMVLAMAPHGRIAGSASALLGVAQFALGATAGAAVSALNNGTAVPLAMVVATCGVGAMLTYWSRPAPRPAAVVPT